MNRSLSISLLSLLTLAAASAASAATAPTAYVLDHSSTSLLGPSSLGGVSYQTGVSVGTGTLAVNSFSTNEVNANGQAVVKFTSATGGGSSAYLFNPANTASPLTYAGPGILVGTVYKDSVASLSDGGVVVGYSTAGTNTDAWAFAGGTNYLVTGTGLGNLYNYNSTNWSVSGLAAGGAKYAIGYTNRYTGISSSSLAGYDGWFLDTSATNPAAVIIPLISGSGTTYTATVDSATVATITNTYQYNYPIQAVSDKGVVVGSSNRYFNGSFTGASPTVNFGNDEWMYTGAATPTTTQIGLVSASTSTGVPVFTNFSASSPTEAGSVYAINASGQIAGRSAIYTSTTGSTSTTNYQAWIYSPSSTPGTLTTTASAFTGNTNYVTGSFGTYQAVGLAGATSNFVFALNAKGEATGTSGSDTWYYSGVTGAASVKITPSASTYLNSGGSPVLTLNQFNDYGLVGGYAARYKAGTFIGYDAFVYDPSFGTSGTTFIVNYNPSNTTTYAYSIIQYLSDSGIALGYYQLTNSGAKYLFAWYDNGTTSPTFITLPSYLTDSTLADAGWATLANSLTVGPDGQIYGLGTTTSPATAGIFELEPFVPEPATLGILSVAAVGLLARRRKA